MLKITMFRVETPDGEGPYMSALFDGAPYAADILHMRRNHTDEAHHCPYDDPKLNYTIAKDEVCGFATLAALEEWFAGYEDPLYEYGYSIVAYTVPYTSCRFGTNQDVFLKKDAEWSRTMSLLDC